MKDRSNGIFYRRDRNNMGISQRNALVGISYFVYLLWVGLNALKTRTIKTPILFIMPLIFLGLQYNLLTAKTTTILFFIIVFLVFFVFSWFWHKRKRLTFHLEHKEISLPGSWETFLLVMGIFTIKYVFGFLHSEKPDIAQNYLWAEILFSGAITGIAWGRSFCYYYRFKKKDLNQ